MRFAFIDGYDGPRRGFAKFWKFPHAGYGPGATVTPANGNVTTWCFWRIFANNND